jgi:hypothetical protein
MITVQDVTAPTLTGTPYPGTSGTNACMSNATTAAPFNAANAVQGYTDNCLGAVTATLTNTNVTGTDCGWTVTYTFSVKDVCNNTLANQSYSNTGSDQTAPTLTGTPYGGTSGTNACMANAATAAPFNATNAIQGYSDNCLGAVTASLTNTNVTGTDCGWTVTYTFSVKDICNNTLANQTYSNTGSDQTAPTLTGTPYAGTTGTNACKVDAATAAPFSASNAIQGYTDNCLGAVTATLTNTAVTGTDCSWTVTYTFTVKDGCNNELTNRMYSNTGGDQTPPVISTPSSSGSDECQGTDPDANTGFIAWLASNGGASANDACNSVSWSNNSGPATWSVGCDRQIEITFTATDNCGNSSYTTSTYTIEDNTGPAISPAASNSMAECQGPNPNANTFYIAWLANHGGASASDLCGNNVTWSNNTMTAAWSGDCSETIEITFTAEDDCGNASQTTASFTINDTTGPAFSLPASNAGSECQGPVPGANTGYTAWLTNHGGATASDLCGNGVNWGDNSGTAVWNDDGCTRSITITYSATDQCSNTSMTTATYTIVDTTAPNIGDPAQNSSVQCDGSGNTTQLNAWLASNGGADADDLCSAGVTWSNNFTGLSDGCGATGTAMVTFAATDGCGNTSYTTASFTIVDNINPVISTQASPMTVECNGTGNTTELNNWLTAHAGAVASDACSGSVTWSNNYTALSDGCGATGSALVTFGATDACGNTSYTSATFTIVDTTPPDVTAGTIADCYESVALAEAAAIAATIASDDCSAPFMYSANTTPGVCDSTITVTVTDACGNSDNVVYETAINCQNIRFKVMLEGPYDSLTHTMVTTINNNNLLPGENCTIPFVGDTPHGQPYNTAPYNYNGNTGMQFGDFTGDTPYPADVVDWVLVTVRKDGILPAHNIWTCAGWVHSDGTVTFPEACPWPVINTGSDYYIMVQHRNHLGVLSPGYPAVGVNIECPDNYPYLYWNFTTGDSYKPAFRVGQKKVEVIPEVWAMFTANGEQVNSIKVISSPDRTVWSQQQGQIGYKKGDHNMNISVNSADETLWKNNQNKTSGVVFY